MTDERSLYATIVLNSGNELDFECRGCVKREFLMYDTFQSFCGFWEHVRKAVPSFSDAQLRTLKTQPSLYYFETSTVIRVLKCDYESWMWLFNNYRTAAITLYVNEPHRMGAARTVIVDNMIVNNYVQNSPAAATATAPASNNGASSADAPSDAGHVTITGTTYDLENRGEYALEQSIVKNEFSAFVKILQFRNRHGREVNVDQWNHTFSHHTSALSAIIESNASYAFLDYLLTVAKRKVDVNEGSGAAMRSLLSTRDHSSRLQKFRLLQEHGLLSLTPGTDKSDPPQYKYCFLNEDAEFYRTLMRCSDFNPNIGGGIVLDYLIEFGNEHRLNTLLNYTSPSGEKFRPWVSYDLTDDRNSLIYCIKKESRSAGLTQRCKMFATLLRLELERLPTDSSTRSLPIQLILYALNSDRPEYLEQLVLNRDKLSFVGSFPTQFTLSILDDKDGRVTTQSLFKALTVSRLKLLETLNNKFQSLNVQNLFNDIGRAMNMPRYRWDMSSTVREYVEKLTTPFITYENEQYTVTKKRSCDKCVHDQCEVVILECKKLKSTTNQ